MFTTTITFQKLKSDKSALIFELLMQKLFNEENNSREKIIQGRKSFEEIQ